MKTLDHSFNVDGLRKSGRKMESDTETVVATVRRRWLLLLRANNGTQM
jgi:hypothetical protein